MGLLNTHIFPLRMNADGFRVSKRMSKGNTQNATCASRSKSGSYRTLQIRTAYVLMWDRIEIGVPLKRWYPQELHDIPKNLFSHFQEFLLDFFQELEDSILRTKTCFLAVQRHELSTPSGLELFAFCRSQRRNLPWSLEKATFGWV